MSKENPIRPYLIQTGKIKPITKPAIVGIDSLVDLHYMGSAEFEFGALPQSLHRVVNHLDTYEIVKTGIVNFENAQLFLICKPTDAEELTAILLTLRDEKPYRLKENIGLDANLSGKEKADSYWFFDFWWDVENDYFFVVGKENAKKVMIALRALEEKWTNPNL